MSAESLSVLLRIRTMQFGDTSHFSSEYKEQQNDAMVFDENMLHSVNHYEKVLFVILLLLCATYLGVESCCFYSRYLVKCSSTFFATANTLIRILLSATKQWKFIWLNFMRKSQQIKSTIFKKCVKIEFFLLR